MGSEQSSQNVPKQGQRAPPVRRGHTIATSNRQDITRNTDPTASGNNSPGASMCSDSELPYISYTVGRPIGDSPKHTTRQRPDNAAKKALTRRRASEGASRTRRVPPTAPPGVVVVRAPVQAGADAELSRLQEIPTFLPIMRGTLGLPGARDPDVLEGLDFRPWVRLSTRYQAHLSACAQQLAADQHNLASKVKEVDLEISRQHSQFVERQRSNARNAERLSRVREVSHQLTRCQSLLNQTLQDIEELNNFLPEEKRLEPFVWNT